MSNKWVLTMVVLFLSQVALGVTGRNPTGVNVRATGPTTVFLTMQGVAAGQTSTDAFWCGELNPAVPLVNGVATGANPCQPGTMFGHLPKRLTQTRASGNGVSNLTDIMTVPSSVARRAYQAALQGNDSRFFYVRKFTGGGPDQYVVVTCRMAGGGARVPLALMKVTPYYETPNGRKPVYILALNEKAPRMAATVYYNGSGRLKGRWEVVLPGDPEPTDFDLLPEASLPIEQRGLQKRYLVLDRFDIFLPPTGRVTLPGPDPEKIPTNVNGPYKILLRVEATSDKEGNSNTTVGTVASGGVAGFPMPTLRYYVGNPDEIRRLRLQTRTGAISLLLPQQDAQVSLAEPLNFSWAEVPGAALFRLEIRDGSGQELLSALVPKGVGSYTAPPWLLERAPTGFSWRVTAVGRDGEDMAASEWRRVSVQPE